MSDRIEQQTEELAKAQTTAVLLEDWEKQLGSDEPWSDYFEEFADELLGLPNVPDWHGGEDNHDFARRLQELIPDLRHAEETGENLLTQRLRIAEAFVSDGLRIEPERFIRKENK